MLNVHITLQQLLESREHRATRQRLILDRFGFPLVSVTVVQPGEVKNNSNSRFLMAIARQEIAAKLQESGYQILWQWHENLATGPEALYSVKTDATALKSCCIELEEHHPLGRLWDIDVIDLDEKPVSRDMVDRLPRRCLICNADAHRCSRSREHSQDSLTDEISRRVSEFQQLSKC